NQENTEKLLSPDVKAEAVKPVKLAMPMSGDHQYLRLSILPELLRTLSYNHARNQPNAAYYEFGSVFISKEEVLTKQPDENAGLARELTVACVEHPSQQESKLVVYYVLK